MSQCSTCHAGCCRSFAIPVTGADILTLMTQRGLSFWDFVCRWADPSGAIAQRFAPHFRFPDDPNTPYVICLSHTYSQNFPGTTMCRFLDEGEKTSEYPLGIAKCSVYLDRPMTCRAYPTQLNEAGDQAEFYPVPEYGRGNRTPAYKLCPGPWSTEDFDPIQQLQSLVVARYEMKFFHLLARSWNEQPGAWEVFPEFLQLVYSARIGSGMSNDTSPADSTPAVANSLPAEVVSGDGGPLPPPTFKVAS
jgi:Fe-S-cluster containining protein